MEHVHRKLRQTLQTRSRVAVVTAKVHWHVCAPAPRCVLHDPLSCRETVKRRLAGERRRRDPIFSRSVCCDGFKGLVNHLNQLLSPQTNPFAKTVPQTPTGVKLVFSSILRLMRVPFQGVEVWLQVPPVCVLCTLKH